MMAEPQRVERPRIYRHAYIRVIGGENPPTVPKKCRQSRYHVWRWVSSSDDRHERPPAGLQCQCGAIEAKG